jgi:tetratricopeptide (TPR) repeat protein
MHRVRLLVGLLLLAAAAPVQAQPQVQQQAQAALQARRYDDAIRLVTPLIRQNPRNVQALLLRAQAYEGRGDFAPAASDYQAGGGGGVVRLHAQRGLVVGGGRGKVAAAFIGLGA